MKRMLGMTLLVVFTSLLLAQEKETEQAAKPADKDAHPVAAAKADQDVLAEVKAMNSDKYAPPPTEFRKGHVTPRKLPENAIQKQKGGFTVSLPSGSPIPTPAVYDGKVYVSGGFGCKEFYCFDADTGALVWGLDLDDDGASSAACEDGVTVFNTESCTIFAVDSKTGKLLWSYFLGDPLMSSPTIAGGKVFTSYPAMGVGQVQQQAVPQGKAQAGKGRPPQATHALACFDLKTGKILWQRWIDSDVMSSPVAVGKDLYATSFAGTVYRFRQSDGEILSAKRSRATSAPVVVGDKVFLTQRAEGKGEAAAEALARVDRDSGKEELNVNTKRAKYLDHQVQQKAELADAAKKLDAGNGFGAGAPASANAAPAMELVGQANVASLQAYQGSRALAYRSQTINCMGDEVICNDQITGKKLWGFKLKGDLEKVGGALAAPPAEAGDNLFLATLTGEVLQMNPKDGKIVKQHKVGHPVRFQPAIANGRLYVGTQNGKLVCVDLGDKKFTGWTQWGGNAARTGTSKVGKKVAAD